MNEQSNAHEDKRWLLNPMEPVFDGLVAGPRYGDDLWDLQPIIFRESAKGRHLDLGTIPAEYRESIRNVLAVMANPNHPAVVEVGASYRGKPAIPTGVITAFYGLRTIANWGHEQGLRDFPDWTQWDADRFLEALRTGRHRPNGGALAPEAIRRYVDQLKDIRASSPALPGGGLAFQPWSSLSSVTVAEVQRQSENSTTPLAWETWAPVVAAAWTVVNRFSPDILLANEAMRSLPADPRGPGGSYAWRVVQQWAESGGVVPLHTGYGRTTANRGAVNIRLIARMLRINDSIFNKSNHNFRPEAIEMFDEMALDPERSALGGLVQPTVPVIHSDGTTTPWISEIGLGEAEYLTGILRGSCYVMLAALTGMRDSEIQSLTRNTATTLDGLPALAGRQYKGIPEAEGQERGWWAPEPIFRTIEVVSALSLHPTHLFARSAADVGAYDATRDIRRLIAFVNGNPRTRLGRGQGLGLDPVYVDVRTSTNGLTLRRSFSVYTATKPGAELGLGIQLGHLGARTTTGYFSDGAQQLTKTMDDDRRFALRGYAAAIISGTETGAGPARKKVQEMRAQIINDPRRAEYITNKLAERLHLGITNDCMFNASTAACGSNGPFLGDHICAGSDCANSLYTTKHRRVLESHIERIDKFLDGGKGHQQFIEHLRKDRARIVALLREMTREQGLHEEES